MTIPNDSSDASAYYQENAAADVARMDSSAAYGNLADAMKNATFFFPPPQIFQIRVMDSPQRSGR